MNNFKTSAQVGDEIFVRSNSLTNVIEFVSHIHSIYDGYVYFLYNGKKKWEDTMFTVDEDTGLTKVELKMASAFLIRTQDLTQEQYLELFFNQNGWINYLTQNEQDKLFNIIKVRTTNK